MNRSTTLVGVVFMSALVATLWLVWPDDGSAPIETLSAPVTVAAVNVTPSRVEEVEQPTATPEPENVTRAFSEQIAEAKRFLATLESRGIKSDQLPWTRAQPSSYESPPELVVLRAAAKANSSTVVRYESLDHEAKARVMESLRAKVLQASTVDVHSIIHDAEMLGFKKEDFDESLTQLLALGVAWVTANTEKMRVNLQAGCPMDAKSSIWHTRRVMDFLGIMPSEDFSNLADTAQSRDAVASETPEQRANRHKKARDENGCLLG